MALELAEDVQAVYGTANEQIKRGYNQAFFKKLYITAEWDDDQTETSVEVSGTELTDPYALLLTEGLFEQAEAEAEAIRANKPTTRNRAGSAADERSTDPVSIYEQMAGIVGQPSKSPWPMIRRLHRERFGEHGP